MLDATDYWVTNADSFMHQVFMIVMGGLYFLAYLGGISYKAANIYCYFVLFPLSFMLILKGFKKFLFFPLSFLFFLIPGYEKLSNVFFNRCVMFLNQVAYDLDSNYIGISVYLCLILPLLLYLPLIYFKIGKRKFLELSVVGAGLLLFYFMAIYPNFQNWLVLLQQNL